MPTFALITTFFTGHQVFPHEVRGRGGFPTAPVADRGRQPAQSDHAAALGLRLVLHDLLRPQVPDAAHPSQQSPHPGQPAQPRQSAAEPALNPAAVSGSVLHAAAAHAEPRVHGALAGEPSGLGRKPVSLGAVAHGRAIPAAVTADGPVDSGSRFGAAFFERAPPSAKALGGRTPDAAYIPGASYFKKDVPPRIVHIRKLKLMSYFCYSSIRPSTSCVSPPRRPPPRRGRSCPRRRRLCLRSTVSSDASTCGGTSRRWFGKNRRRPHSCSSRPIQIRLRSRWTL